MRERKEKGEHRDETLNTRKGECIQINKEKDMETEWGNLQRKKELGKQS